MTSTTFDDITNAFVSTLTAGTLSLGVYSLPLLGAFALIGWYWTFGRELAMGASHTGEALASALFYVVTIGIAYWLLVNLSAMATASYETFLQWGLAAGGSATSGLLLTPSAVVDLGFRIAEPLQTAATGLAGGLKGLWSMPLIMAYDFASTVIVVAFPLVAIALMMTQIEYHLAVMLGAVLIPFGVFGPTAFFTEFSIGWITGNLLRVMVTAVMVGVGYPLFSTATIALTTGGDPTKYSAIIVALMSLLYAGMTWWVPTRAATMCGRVALGLSGSTVLSGAMTLARFGMAGVQVVRGASSMLQRRTA